MLTIYTNKKITVLNKFLKPFEYEKYIFSEHAYRRKYPFSFEGLALTEGYIKGRLKIVFCFDVVADYRKVGPAAVTRRHFLDLHCYLLGSRIDQFSPLEVEVSRRWQDALMFVGDIEVMQLQELVLASRVGLNFSADEVSDFH